MGLAHNFQSDWMYLQRAGSTDWGVVCGASGRFVIYRGFMNKFVVLYYFYVKTTISKINARLGILQKYTTLIFFPLSFCFSGPRSCSITLCHQIHTVDQTNLGLWLSGLGFLSAVLQTCATIPGPSLPFKMPYATRPMLGGSSRKGVCFILQCWVRCYVHLNNSYSIKPGF